MATAKRRRSQNSASFRRPSLPSKVVTEVWTRAAGRCEFLGCNAVVWKDPLTTREFNRAEIGHIVAASPDGPRGDPVHSPQLAKEPSNLMLLCGTHHPMIDDKRLVDEYPVLRLRDFKRVHHARIEFVTGIAENMKSTPVVLRVAVDEHQNAMAPENVGLAILSRGRYPDETKRADIDLRGLPTRDHEEAFWREARKLMRSRWENVQAVWNAEDRPNHLSVFAFAPMPLLIEFGRMIGDKIHADVFNRIREPSGWSWPEDGEPLKFTVTKPTVEPPVEDVVLKICISGEVQVPAHATFDPSAPTFEVRSDRLGVDMLRRFQDLEAFGANAREVMDAIQRTGAKRIHVFYAAPVAALVHFGRSLLPKLHAELVLYDFNRTNSGWHRAFTLS